jgi:hypothetical protein
MPANAESRHPYSPLSILTELAVEGASSFIEAQRIFLNLAQQENDLLMNGVKERIGDSAPAIAMADLVRRSLDTFIHMQQEFLTLTSKETLHLLDTVQSGKSYPSTHLVDLAREGMENFVRANQKFLDVLTQETMKATAGKSEPRVVRKRELSKLAREASDLFIDAQKKVLDVVGQQMNVNLSAATQAVETLSPARLAPITELPTKAVQSFIKVEQSLLQKLTEPIKKSKVVEVHKRPRRRAARHSRAA